MLHIKSPNQSSNSVADCYTTKSKREIYPIPNATPHLIFKFRSDSDPQTRITCAVPSVSTEADEQTNEDMQPSVTVI